MEAQVAAPTTILTLELAEKDRDYFERLRRLHYPALLNRVPAHVTLFHTLPPLEEIREALQRAADSQAFVMRVTSLRSLGRGVAFALDSSELLRLHSSLASSFSAHLTPQDRQPFKPHIVIQNKAQPGEARTLKASLEATFRPFDIHSSGLILWNYLGGPWQCAEVFPFHPLS